MVEDTEAREKMIQTIEEMHRITEATIKTNLAALLAKLCAMGTQRA